MGANIEITNNGIVSPQTSEIKQEFETIFTDAFGTDLNLDSSTPQGVLIDDLTQMKMASNSVLLYLMNQFNPETASGIFQDALASLYFIERKSATHSIVSCRCMGVAGTEIKGLSSGTPAKAQSTNGDVFECVVGGTIQSNGYVDLYFRAVETGPIPVGANTVNKIYQAVVGWDSVNNTTQGTVGENQENRADFEKRRKESLALQASGSLAAVQAGIANLNNITDYKVWENVTDSQQTVRGVHIAAHSVWICVNSAVSSDEVADVIHKNLSAGCGTSGVDTSNKVTCSYTDPITGVDYTYYYYTPTESPVYVKVKLTASVPEATQNQIKQAIVDNFNGTSDDNYTGITIGDNVYASRFFGAISDLGVGLVTIQVSKTSGSGYTDTLTYDMNVLPTISESNITIEVA